MKTRSTVSLVSLLLALTGCASQGSLENTRNDIYAIKTRLFSVEKELGEIRDETKGRMDALEQGTKNELNAVRKIAADTQAASDANKSEIQGLNGKLDDLGTSVKKPNDDLTRYREDADKRIIALEERLVTLQKTVDELTKRNGASLHGKEIQETAESNYNRALETYKTGNMPAAREQLTRFIDQYPKHELVGNARYWIGETLFNEKNYEAAIVAFQDVIKTTPQHPKASAAMLRQARAFKAINDPKSAKYVLKKLIELHPKSEDAKKARELLKELK